MSLVSALSERIKVDNNNTTSRSVSVNSRADSRNSRVPSVYQNAGEPLSKEALFRARMKYGYYQSPTTNSTLGVSDPRLSADVAASLADLTHVNMPTYLREIDENAHKAARSIGKRSLHRQQSFSSRASSISSNIEGASAASKAYSMSYMEIPTKINTVKRTYSISSAASASASVLRNTVSNTSNIHNQVQGQQRKCQSLTTPRPNLSKLLNSAERKADAAIKHRWDPQRKNFQYGIRKNESNGPEDRKQFEIDNRVMQRVILKTQNSKQSLVNKQKQEESELKQLQRVRVAKHAAVKVKDTNFTESIDKDIEAKRQERETYLKNLTSTQVLSLARAKVDQQLQLIEAAHAEDRIFQNDAFNKAAMKYAQSRADSRSTERDYYANRINLGGGLWLSPENINEISQNLLNPILGEIDSKAKNQRDTDVEIANRTKNYNNEMAKFKSLQKEKEDNNTKILRDTEENNTAEYNKIAKQLEDDYTKLKYELQAQVDEKRKDYQETVQRLEDLTEECEMKLKLQRDLADKELDSWEKYKDNDIVEAEKEQAELLAPYNQQLESANDDQRKLSTEYDNIMGNMRKLQTFISSHKGKIKEYTSLIEVQENHGDREKVLLTQLAEQKEEANHILEDEVMVRAQRIKEQLELSNKEYEMKQLEISALINERQDELQKIDIVLQEERLKLLDAMQKVAKARGDEKLDENKIRVLFGMTSDEFMEMHGLKVGETKEEDREENKEEGETDNKDNKELKEEKIDEKESKILNDADDKVSEAKSNKEKQMKHDNNENDDDEIDNNNNNDDDDTPSFSGFSQGSITNNDDVEETAVGSPNQSDETGYFKEVF
ncbi:hypothetical protein RI543_000428 [Arxiozyma heterogenica]|uniref:Uncharacterized protein n=1 Tax=Arxiozyma heterogenica TaxID=278026 RepID=A0AAN7W651_9SACH|nr:hypothetical protein RI543_000428 [Kazachstania heterogenica]